MKLLFDRPLSAFRPTLLANCELWLPADAPGSLTQGVGMAAQFTAANSEYLSVADNASLSVGDIDFAWALWVRLDSKTDARVFVSKSGALVGNDDFEYRVFYDNGTDRLVFTVGNNTTSGAVYADALGSPALSTWYHVVAQHDATADTVSIQVNNGTVDSAAYSGGSWDSGGALELGRQSNGFYHDGQMCGVGFWKRTLTAAEVTTLYAPLGAGLGYADVYVNGLTGSLISYWDLGEPSGTRSDQHGTNHLTDNNTVTTAAGKIPNAVTTWVDQSGNGRNATQATQANKPRVTRDDSGRLLVRFDGVDDVLSCGDVLDSVFAGASAKYTAFAVVKSTSVAATQAIWGKWLNTGNQRGPLLDLRLSAGALYGGLYTVLKDASNDLGSRGSTDCYNAFKVVAGVFDATASPKTAEHALWVNGAAETLTVFANTGAANAVNEDNTTPLQIGGNGASGSLLTGDLAEIIIYSRALTDGERNRVTRYLGRKFAIGVS